METWMVVAAVLVLAVAVCGFIMSKQLREEEAKEARQSDTQPE